MLIEMSAKQMPWVSFNASNAELSGQRRKLVPHPAHRYKLGREGKSTTERWNLGLGCRARSTQKLATMTCSGV